jgi:hypothetical protein
MTTSSICKEYFFIGGSYLQFVFIHYVVTDYTSYVSSMASDDKVRHIEFIFYFGKNLCVQSLCKDWIMLYENSCS